MKEHLKNIIKKIEWLSGRHGAWTVFSDFIANGSYKYKEFSKYGRLGRKRKAIPGPN